MVMRMKVKTLVIGTLLALSLNACGDKPASIKPSAEQKAPDYRVGDVINTDKFTISIDRVEIRRSVGNDYLQKQASSGGIYVVVNYTYKNISNKPIGAFSLPRISLRSPDGSKYSADIDASSTYAMENQRDEKILSDLNPGIQTHGSQVFEIGEQMYSSTSWKILIDADKEVLVNINAGQNQTRTVDSQPQNQPEQNAANIATGGYTDNTSIDSNSPVNTTSNSRTQATGRAAYVFSPPSNVRYSPLGEVMCVLPRQGYINVFEYAGTTTDGAREVQWYYTDACGGEQGVIAATQFRY